MKHTLANVRVLIPTLAGLCCLQLSLPKKGLNLVDLLESVFYLSIHGCTYPTGVVLV